MNLKEILFPAFFLFLACAFIAFLYFFISSKTTPEVNSALESLLEEDIPEFEEDGYEIEPTEAINPTENTGSASNDPIVKCMLNECGTIEMKSSQCKLSGCCVIGNEYKVMTNQAECQRLQDEYAGNTKKPPNFQSPKAVSNPSYVSVNCVTVYGTYLSYGKDYAEANQYCANLKAEALSKQNEINTMFPSPTPIIYETSNDSPHNTLTVEDCRNQVNNYYAPLIQGCSIQFGSSSARDACIQIYSNERQEAYNACG